MIVYIVDDEENKGRAVAETFATEFPGNDVEMHRSYQSGLKAIVLRPPSLVLLDMTMPNYDVGPRESGGRERRYAGREVIRQIARRRIKCRVIVITQYEQFEEDGRELDLKTLESELADAFPECFVGAIYYNASDSGWIEKLREIMRTTTFDFEQYND